MATTIIGAFNTLRTNLSITDTQKSSVSTTQTNVRKVLSNNLTLLEDFLTGSYVRGTLIPPMSEADVDIFVVLSVDYYHHYNGQNGGQAGLLDWIRRTLIKEYPKPQKLAETVKL